MLKYSVGFFGWGWIFVNFELFVHFQKSGSFFIAAASQELGVLQNGLPFSQYFIEVAFWSSFRIMRFLTILLGLLNVLVFSVVVIHILFGPLVMILQEQKLRG